MWSLILKDLTLMRASLLLYLVLAATFPLLFGRTPEGAMVIALWSFILPYMVVGRLCYQEELNRGLAFLRSLPLRPATIVWSKFVGVLALFGFFSLTLAGAGSLGKVWGSLGRGPDIPPAALVLLPMGLAMVLSGLILLVFFVWDYRRAGYVYVLPLLGLLPAAFPDRIGPLLQRAAENLGRNAQLYLGGFVLVALAAYLLLGWVSAIAFGRKDVG
ncbi:MAG: ABC-2 transporter permease [Moorellales bacterium]